MIDIAIGLSEGVLLRCQTPRKRRLAGESRIQACGEMRCEWARPLLVIRVGADAQRGGMDRV